jgi:hypothetical protein
VLPDDFLFRRHLDNGRWSGVQENIAIGQHGDVVGIVLALGFPFHFTLGIDDDRVSIVDGENAIRGPVRIGFLFFGVGNSITSQRQDRESQRNPHAVLHDSKERTTKAQNARNGEQK